MPLGMEVSLGPDHIVLDGDTAVRPPPKNRGRSPLIFGPYLLWPKGWMDQDATWYGDRPRPRPHCVRRGSSCLHGLGYSSSSPTFRPMSMAKRSPISATAELLFCACFGLAFYVFLSYVRLLTRQKQTTQEQLLFLCCWLLLCYVQYLRY